MHIFFRERRGLKICINTVEVRGREGWLFGVGRGSMAAGSWTRVVCNVGKRRCRSGLFTALAYRLIAWLKGKDTPTDAWSRVLGGVFAGRMLGFDEAAVSLHIIATPIGPIRDAQHWLLSGAIIFASRICGRCRLHRYVCTSCFVAEQSPKCHVTPKSKNVMWHRFEGPLVFYRLCSFTVLLLLFLLAFFM